MTGFDGYNTDGFYDEMFAPDGNARPAVQMLVERIESLPEGELTRRHIAVEHALLRMGITFNVYADEQGVEKIFPFDLIPRIIDANEWEWIERGLKQRIHALNLFIDDVYHDQKDPQRWRCSVRCRALIGTVSAAMHRFGSAARCLVSHHWDGFGPRRRRTDLCLGRQSRVSIRGFLRRGKSAVNETDFSAAFWNGGDSTGGGLPDSPVEYATLPRN